MEIRRLLPRLDLGTPIWIVALASAGAVQDFGGVRALPTSFLFDREGRIRHTVTGSFAGPALAQAVDRLLDEAPADPSTSATAPAPAPRQAGAAAPSPAAAARPAVGEVAP